MLIGLAQPWSHPPTAAAHPLGNFSINRYAKLVVGQESIALRYVVDMAEIPAFQELRNLDINGDGVLSDAETAEYLRLTVAALLGRLDLRIHQEPLSWQLMANDLSLSEGQGGLKLLRVEIDALYMLPVGAARGAYASFRDSNYSGRVGWKEVVVRTGEGVALLESSASTLDASDELRAYPVDQLSSPLNVSEARFRFVAGDQTFSPVVTKSQPGTKTSSKSLDGFARLIEKQHLTPAVVALALLAAAAWGAAHALGPGHGKTLVAAYLIGSRGTPWHAILLGLTVTITHTSTVVTLGLVTLYASHYIAAEQLYLWLGLISGLLVVVMGGALFLARMRPVLLIRGVAVGHKDHYERPIHGHDPTNHVHANLNLADRHEHNEHGHSHRPTQPGLRGLIGLGISGGLLPCPTAMVVMLGALALDRVVYGLVLVLSFSLGLALVLTGLGVALVYARSALGASPRLHRLSASPLARQAFEVVPMLSSLIIFALGLLLTGRAISDIV